MDADRFKQLVNDTRRTCDDIQQMLRNAVKKGERELAWIAEEALNTRFPGWNKVHHKATGAKPTLACFRSEKKQFPNSKEAYVWLIERLIHAKPDLFETISWETVVVAKGRKRNYFGQNIKSLFHGSPHLANDPNNYARLTNGWYANTNLSNSLKFDILCRFAAIAKLEHETDWSWKVEDPSDDLRANEERKALAKQLMTEIAVSVRNARKSEP